MAKLIVTVGLPGSGKSTRARAWIDDDPDSRAGCSRDDLRRLLHGRRLATAAQERQVTRVQYAAIRTLLRDGISVVVDDTNLNPHRVERFQEIAGQHSADFEVWDLTDVDVDECVARDRERGGGDQVGEHVIRDMYHRYLAPAGQQATG